MKQVNIAVVGATGAVGETIIRVLEQRKFPLDKLYPLASEKSAGNKIRFKNKEIEIIDLAQFDFSKADIALFSAGGEISAQFAPLAAKHCVVIDNTSYFRYEEDIPLVIPEVNPEAIAQYKTRNIIANPNCSTIQMLVAIKPIYDAVGIKRINVATYQAVSGSGKKAISELVEQVGQLLNGKPVESKVYPHQIAFNVLPHIDEFLDNGYTKEEMKMVWETQKILNDNAITVNPTTVRVPVLYGHSEAIHLELKKPLEAATAKKLLNNEAGVKVIDDFKTTRYPTVMTHAIGKDEVFVGRIRQDISHPSGLNLWVVADNVRKGAATNAVQIAEHLLSNDFI